ncbi:hypothetical protein ACFXHK_08440, partial [Embleya sp. NPDC059267]|uniref:hypothetical protein n=1 Tax=Embleya sp. NPDC059267 TaxID=3346798 RepID=UPI0036B3BB50
MAIALPVRAQDDPSGTAPTPTPAVYPGRPAPAPRTLVDILDATVRDHPNEPALDDGRRTLTYRALAAEVDTLRRRLADAGLGVGARVGIRVPS